MSEDKKQGGMEPIPSGADTCTHPYHQPPTMLYIPPGQQYRHVCSGCGQERVLRGSPISFEKGGES